MILKKITGIQKRMIKTSILSMFYTVEICKSLIVDE